MLRWGVHDAKSTIQSAPDTFPNELIQAGPALNLQIQGI